MSATEALPRWDMTMVYPALESAEFAAALEAANRDLDALQALFDARGIATREPGPTDAATVETCDAALAGYNALVAMTTTLRSYVYSFVATNSRDDVAQALLSQIDQGNVRLSQLETRLTAWIGSLDVEVLIASSPTAAEHAFALRKAHEEAKHLMTPAEEALAAELAVTAGMAWGKLHGNVTSRLSVEIELEGKTQRLPMSMIRNLATNPDRGVRRRAYEAELAGWKQVEVPLAASLNSIKGQVNTLARRRGWGSPLDEALFRNNIDRQTLDAMLEAARASFPHFRRYLRLKARALGLPVLAWYDLFAPLPGVARQWPYDEATRFIEEQFGTYTPALSGFAARARRERWVDAEPRPGKRDGAFCMLVRGDESRVFMNYQPTYSAVSTLAHELGHGYHNLNLAARTPMQRRTPMALAETASIFCETIITQAALRQASASERLVILEASLQGSCQVVVDISSRFLFEARVFERRRQRELSIDELKGLMVEAQQETYGDGLDSETLHPYMWAMKPHYYNADRSFYNFPYMFGLLFGLGLYARYRADPEAFTHGYDDLLASTGLADAATLAGRFGIDPRLPEFWASSLEIIREDIDRFAGAAVS